VRLQAGVLCFDVSLGFRRKERQWWEPIMILKNLVVLNAVTHEPVLTIGEVDAPVAEVLQLLQSGIVQQVREAFAPK
jgi:hypothetical protein